MAHTAQNRILVAPTPARVPATPVSIGRVLDGKWRLTRPRSAWEGVTFHDGESVIEHRPLSVRHVSLLAGGEDLEAYERARDAVKVVAPPHAILPLDVFADDDELWVVYERLPGESLADRLARGVRVTRDDALYLARDVVALLAPLHEAGLAHGGLSPLAVRVDEKTGACVGICDAGLGVLGAAVRATAGPGAAVPLALPPGYVAPEQATGRVATSPAADVFALAAILYHAVSGKPPFGAGRAVLSRVLHAEPAPLIGASRAVEHVILDGLRKTAGERLPTGRVLLDRFDEACERLLERPEPRRRAGVRLRARQGDAPIAPAVPLRAEAPTVLTTPLPDEIPSRFASLRPVLLGLAGLGVLAVSLGAVAAWLTPSKAPEAAAPVVAAPAKLAPTKPATVRFRFEVTPPGADVTIDDRPVDGAGATVTRGTRPVHVVFEARGYEPSQMDIVPDSDQTVRLALKPAAPSTLHRRPPAAAPAKTADAPRRLRDLRDPFSDR